MAWSTGDAWGLTDTRSGASRNANHSAVMSDTIDALEAWWPPTLTPERLGRTRLAWCTIAVASHSTRRWTRSSSSRSSACGCSAIATSGPLTDGALPAQSRQHLLTVHLDRLHRVGTGVV